MSADTTIDPGRRIELAQLRQHVQPVHALHHQIEQDDVRLVEEVALERGQPVLRLDDLVAGGLEDLAEAAPRQSRIVDDQDLALHTRSRMASASRSSGTAASLSPASTTDRGMP